MPKPISFILLLFYAPFILSLQRKDQAVFMQTDYTTEIEGLEQVSADLFNENSREFKDFIPFKGSVEDDFSSFHGEEPVQDLPLLQDGQVILAGVSQDSSSTNNLQSNANTTTTADNTTTTTPTTGPSLSYRPNPIPVTGAAESTPQGLIGTTLDVLRSLGGIPCSESQDEGVLAACQLCKATDAFFLTKDNWFKVSLAHNYRTELSKVISYAHNLFPTATWVASFGSGKICIASTTEIPNTNINLTVHYVTNGEITDYIKTNFISKDAPSTVMLSAFRYVPSEQNDHIDKFVLKYQVDLLVPISAMASLNFNTAWIYAAEKKALYKGIVNLQNIQSFPFELELTQDETFFYAKTSVSTLSLSVGDIWNGVGISTFDQSELLKDITMAHGLQDILKFQVSTIDFKVIPSTKRVSQFIIGLAIVPEFALTPEFNLKDGYGSITIDITDSGYASLLTIKGQASDGQMQNPFDASVIKSKQEESIVFTQDEDADLLKVSDLENIFKRHDSSFKGLVPEYSNFAAFKSYSLNPLEIHVKNSQIPVYHLKTKLFSAEQLSIGDIEITLAGISGNITARTEVLIPEGSTSMILPAGSSPLFFEQYATAQEISFVHCNHNLDTTLYNETFTNLTNETAQWKHGTTVNYKFLLDKCADVAFCNVMKNMMDCSNTTLTVSGSIDSDGHLNLISGILPHEIVLSTINFTNIVLNIDLKLGDTPELSLYLTSSNQLTLDANKTLTLDGKLLFNGTHGSLLSKTYQSWDETLGLDFIQMSGVELTGQVSPGSCYIKDISAHGILLWGKSCFLLSQEDFRNATFLRERCFYGKGEVMVNVDNIQQSYLNGVYSGLSPFIILFSVLKFEDPFVFKKVSKQFLDLNFTSGVQITYVPKRDAATSTSTNTSANTQTALVEVTTEDDEALPAGFTIKGSSKLLGMEGTIKMHIDMKAQKLAATFHFPGVEVAHGNILLPEDSLQTSNNVEFRISNEYDDDTNGRGVMETDLSVLGFGGSSVFIFSNQNTTFKAVVSSDVFSNIELSGLSYDFQHFVNGTFNVQGKIADDLTNINTFLQDMLKYWAQRVSYVIADMNQSMSDIHTMLLEKTKTQCQLESCPKRYECQDDLIYECSKYKKKQECKKKQEYCLNSTITCQKEETTCIHQVETCVTDDRSSTGECIFTTTECKSFLATCQDWAYTCIGDNITTCEEFEIVDDLSECLEFSWTCQEVEIVDPTCKNECELANRHVENLTANYNTLKTKYDLTQGNIVQLNDFVSWLNKAEENAQGLNVLSFEFEQLFDKLLKPQDIEWKVQYNLFNETRTVTVDKLGLIDQKDLVLKVIDKIGEQLATDFGFKWMTPEEIRRSLHQQLELNTNPAAIFLQVFKKEL